MSVDSVDAVMSTCQTIDASLNGPEFGELRTVHIFVGGREATIDMVSSGIVTRKSVVFSSISFPLQRTKWTRNRQLYSYFKTHTKGLVQQKVLY